jgi:3-oxoacyl-[acyl-carrier-protein] synthase II
MIVGATGTRIHPLRTIHVVLQEELATGADPTKLARPFDANRTGLVLGEGAGAVILEEFKAAETRGASILGEITGYGSSTVLERGGLACCDLAIENVLRQSLERAGLGTDQVGHIHAHGLGTQKSDAEEAQAIARVFGDRTRAVPVTAAKSYFGNLGAAAGMVELIASLLALDQNQLFPILNYETPDPACPIGVVREPVPPGDTFVNVNVTPHAQASAVVIRRL